MSWVSMIERLSGGLIEVEEDEQPTTETVNEAGDGSEERPPQASPKPVTQQQPVSGKDVTSGAVARSKKDLDTVLSATPEKFREFLEKKEEYADLLREGETPQNKIDSLATAKAARSVRLTVNDVTEAAKAAADALEGIKADFDVWSRDQRNENVDGPAQALKEQEAEIARITDEIESLQAKLREKQSGIEPARRTIEAEEAKIEHAKAVFDASCVKVQQAMRQLEQTVIASMGQKK